MKYEEWIKYEELRKKILDSKAWILLEPELFKQPNTTGPKPIGNEKPRLLSAILQVFNSRSI